ncbi:MAG TPA: hypothetical protein PLB89_15520 [Flavobacteriales bacterium]|nr:hypothetical protein [Flavobacteriales bacterium]
MKRRSLLLLTFLLALSTTAQRFHRIHFFECTTDLGASAFKPLFEQVQQLDPNGRISIEGRRLKVAVDRSVYPDALLGALNHAGAGTFTAQPGTWKSDTEAPADLPVFHDTGNPEADRAAYDAAKAAWRNAHPELFPEEHSTTHEQR